MRRSLLAAAAPLVFMAGCAAMTQPLAVAPLQAPASWSFKTPVPPDITLAAVVLGAQRFGMTVVLAESGAVRLEIPGLTASQLDTFCTYPILWKFNGQPFDTFTAWNQRSVANGAGAVKGAVGVFATVLPVEGGSEVTATATFTGGNATESYTLASKRTLERAFERHVLGAIPSIATGDLCEGISAVRTEDRFTGATEYTTTDRPQALRFSPFLFWSSSAPGVIKFGVAGSSQGWRYLKCSSLAVLVDGQRLPVSDVDHDGTVEREGYVIETVAGAVKVGDARILEEAKRIEYRVCNDESVAALEFTCQSRGVARAAREWIEQHP